MRAASIKEMNWSDSQAIGMDMSEAQWVSVNFVKTDMTDVCLKGASLKQVSFTECAWGKADMSGTRQEQVLYMYGDLTQALLQDAHWDGVVCVESDLSGQAFHGP